MANHFNSVQIIVLANQKLKICTVAFMHMDQECMDARTCTMQLFVMNIGMLVGHMI